MRKATFTITDPHLITSISTLSAESKSYIITLHFKVHGTLKINQKNFFIS